MTLLLLQILFHKKTTSELQATASNSNNLMAATEPGLLPNDICYKLLVYDNNGNYVAERDYIRGKESNTAITPALMLMVGILILFCILLCKYNKYSFSSFRC